MLKVLCYLTPYVLLSLCSLGQNLGDFSSDNEHIKAAHSAIVDRLDRKFNIEQSKHAAYKTYLAQVITNHFCDHLQKSEEFLAGIISRIEKKDLKALHDELDTYLQTSYVDAWMLNKAMRDGKDVHKERFNLGKISHRKYKGRFKRSIQLGHNLVDEATKKAHQEIVDSIEYMNLHKLYVDLVTLAIIPHDDEYFAFPKYDTFRSKGSCSICLDEASRTNPLMLLQGCSSHQARHCSACMKQYVLDKANVTSIWHIKCPDNNCKNTLKTCDVLHLYDLDAATKILKKSLIHLQHSNPQFFLCTHENCQKGFQLRPSGQKIFDCNHCHNRFCYDCGGENPHGKTCDIHRNINGIGQLTLMNVVQLCPRCGHGVVRTDGCAKVVCRCGYAMRYVGAFREESEHNNWDGIASDEIVESTSHSTSDEEDDES